MGCKEFLRPEWKKIILFIAILIPALLLSYNGLDCISMGGGCTHYNGFPFPYYSIYDPAALPNGSPSSESSNYFLIILDIIFWYLSVCVVFYSYDKLRNKKRT